MAANDCRDANFVKINKIIKKIKLKWRKLQLVHTFLSIFLKKKMEREMQKFHHIEEAF